MSEKSREWVTPEQVSAFTGIDVSRLTNQRYERVVFPHYPIPGTRKVVYDKAEVDAIIAAARIGTTAEEAMPGVEIENPKLKVVGA